jgi:redox-sensitive bicupin YhaK (pirin superfamily)
LPVIVPKNSAQKGRLEINQDATFYVANLERDADLSYTIQKGRMAYLFVIEGKVMLNDKILYTRDAARIENEEILKIHAQRNTELILIDLPIKYKKNAIPA